MAEFVAEGSPTPVSNEPLTTFMPVGITRAIPPPSPTPVAQPAPPRPAPAAPPQTEAGLASRIAPMARQAVRAPTATPPAPTPRPAPEPSRREPSPPETGAAKSPPPATNTPIPAPVNAVATSGQSADAAGPRSRIPAILVVDDNADYRFVVVREMRRLRPNTIRIEEADGAQAALNILSTLLRDNERVFLLTDFRMPNQTGVDLVNAARRAYPSADIRYLVYSGINLRTAPELRTLSADEFMEKPGDLIELRRQMSRLLERWLGPLPQARVA